MTLSRSTFCDVPAFRGGDLGFVVLEQIGSLGVLNEGTRFQPQ